jgi:uncharacterized repeat protein (TIGR01451 family)
MARKGWRLCLVLLLAAGLAGLDAGCFGVSQNPSYFPHLLPTGDIIRTHAKPPLFGYFTNFDPHAVRLEVRPLESTNPVQTRHVLIATVYDEKGEPRRNRRVEWLLEGVGNIVEVDESGFWPGRGYKVDNKYAVSYTDYCEHVISRGNANPNDDFTIRPGQTWCVITSAVEGDTHVTAYAPEIYNWDANEVFVTKHWVDAEWALPPPAVNRAGTEHAFNTNVFRHTDHQPLANYRVRYRILDGPPALFLPSRTQEAVAVSDLSGNATVTLAQAAPQPGVNRIGIEIIRPPDPTSPSGAGIVIGQGETTKTWQAPQVSLSLAGPPAVAVGQEIAYTIMVNNVGPVETQAMTVRNAIPEGLQYVRSQPPASQEGPQLTWTLGTLGAGQAHTIQVVFRAPRVGQVTNCANVVTVEGQRDEKCVTTQITAPQLKMVMAGPGTGVVGVPITYQVTVTNPGTGPATNVMLTAEYDPGLQHESQPRVPEGAKPRVELPVGTLAAGESKTVPLVLTPTQVGRFTTQVVVTADGGLKDQAEQAVTVQRAQLRVTKSGPPVRYLNRPTTWDIHVINPGDVPLTNVQLRDQLPPELTFTSATAGGQLADGVVVWNLGTLQPKEDRGVQVTTNCVKLTPRAVNVATASADPGLQVQAEAPVEIRGLPAFGLTLSKVGDPVEVGGRLTYRIDVINQGSLPGNKVQVVAVLPKELRMVNATGPAQPRAEGQRIIFPPIDSVRPGETVTYTLEAEALQPGDVRFQVELTSETLQEPVIKQESTTIYRPVPGGGAPAPPAGPPPPAPPAGSGAAGPPRPAAAATARP